MSDLQTESTRPIETPTTEIDEPPNQIQMEQGPLKEHQNWVKWLKNFDFIKSILLMMLFIYFLDLIVSVFVFKQNSSLTESIFEVLKTILLTIAGYVFGKSQDD